MTYNPRDWTPSDVAMVRSRLERSEFRMLRDADAWRDESGAYLADGHVAAARPLVVLDPESDEDAKRLHLAMSADHWYGTPGLAKAVLGALVAKPRPDEPESLGAVVLDASGVRWTRFDEGGVAPWMPEDTAERGEPDARFWSGIKVVRVLSEGWTEGDES